MCGSPGEAEDLVQETFARVLAKPRRVRNEDDVGYLLQALRNTFISSRRAAARRLAPQALEMLTGVVESDDETRKLHGLEFGPSAEDLMQAHVGDYVISYLLDLGRRTAKVVFAAIGEQAQSAVPKAG